MRVETAAICLEVFAGAWESMEMRAERMEVRGGFHRPWQRIWPTIWYAAACLSARLIASLAAW